MAEDTSLAADVSLPRILREGVHRAAGWMHLVAALFVFTSDFLNRHVPQGTATLLLISVCILVVLWLLVRSGWISVEASAASVVFFLLMAMLSFGVFTWQKFSGSPTDGAFANHIEGLKPLQKSLDDLLRVLPGVQKSLAKNNRVQEKAIANGNAVISAINKDLAALNREKGVPIPVLEGILARLGQTSAKNDPDEIAQLLRQKADEYVALKKEMAQFSPIDPNARRLQQEAADDLAKAKFAAARVALHEAAKNDEAAIAALSDILRRRALDAAKAFEQSASIARVQVQYLDAAADYESASKAAAPHDAAYARQLTVKEAEMLYQQGDEFGDNAALAKVIDLDRTILAPPSGPESGADRSMLEDQLGRALFRLGQRDPDTKRLNEAMTYFQAGLAGTSRAGEPLQWATMENDVGITHLSLGERKDDTVQIGQAVIAFEEALKERTPERAKNKWAMTETNLGLALSDLGELNGDTAQLKESVATFRSVLKVFNHERSPAIWADAQNNLGLALEDLGERSKGTAELEQAAVAFERELLEYTPKRAPQLCAMAEANLGFVLQKIGERQNGTARLMDAVTADRQALQLITRKSDPEDWATVEDNLSVALRTLGEREAGSASLSQAVDAVQRTLTVRGREEGLLRWAGTEYDLGLALEALGGRVRGREGIADLENAVSAYQSALDAMQASHAERYETMTAQQLRESIDRTRRLETSLHTSIGK